MPEKYYVIPLGKRHSYTAMVHRESCPMLARMKNAHIWTRNPLDDDKFNHYRKCQKCWPKQKEDQAYGK